MSLAAIAEALRPHRLGVFGALHPERGEGLPPATQTLILIGPLEPDFWDHVTAQPEWLDGQPNPLDRWSRRVIGRLACSLGGKALFPFGGPPWHPFIAWAKASGRAFTSPVELLVHDYAGMMVSYRGALALKERLELPPTGPSPCLSCEDKPCLSACPVNALTDGHYDVPACRSYLDQGAECLHKGCLARRACPISQGYGRLEVQSAYHMRQFHS